MNSELRSPLTGLIKHCLSCDILNCYKFLNNKAEIWFCLLL